MLHRMEAKTVSVCLELRERGAGRSSPPASPPKRKSLMSRASKKPKKAPGNPSSARSLDQGPGRSASEVGEPGGPSRAASRKDSFTPIFLAILLLAGLVYTACKMTPSSYGAALAFILAPQDGPTLGVSRPIRSDEWAILTPQVQAAVRNHFQRFNETSFYREDMRNYFMPPLKDWGLIFRPESWLFFGTSPALAFSAYWAFFMGLFIAGYYLMSLSFSADSRSSGGPPTDPSSRDCRG